MWFILAESKCESQILLSLQASALYRDDEKLRDVVDHWMTSAKKLELLVEELVSSAFAWIHSPPGIGCKVIFQRLQLHCVGLLSDSVVVQICRLCICAYLYEELNGIVYFRNWSEKFNEGIDWRNSMNELIEGIGWRNWLKDFNEGIDWQILFKELIGGIDWNNSMRELIDGIQMVVLIEGINWRNSKEESVEGIDLREMKASLHMFCFIMMFELQNATSQKAIVEPMRKWERVFHFTRILSLYFKYNLSIFLHALFHPCAISFAFQFYNAQSVSSILFILIHTSYQWILFNPCFVSSRFSLIHVLCCLDFL